MNYNFWKIIAKGRVEKYLYLTKHEWRQSWIHGGSIPINLASTYLRQERGGIYTPDETLVHNSPVDLLALGPGFNFMNVKNLTMVGCSINGMKIPDFTNGSIYREDGNILSFCNTASREISRRLGKVCCVKILDVAVLKKIIDVQLGIEGRMGPCEYTDGHERSNFLKSTKDLWQDEYRMFWLGQENKQVKLPPGIAVPIVL